MARQLKRWESPRREGRNDKGRGGAARKRQRQKQLKNLVKKLKQPDDRPNSQNDSDNNHKTPEGRESIFSSLFSNEPGRSHEAQSVELYLRIHLQMQIQPYGVLRSTTSVNCSIAVVNRS